MLRVLQKNVINGHIEVGINAVLYIKGCNLWRFKHFSQKSEAATFVVPLIGKHKLENAFRLLDFA